MEKGFPHKKNKLSNTTEGRTYVTQHDLPALMMFGIGHRMISDENFARLDGESAASILFDIGVPADACTLMI